jgi:hypothetical protein
MDSIIKLMPVGLKIWAEHLTDENVATILTLVGSASMTPGTVTNVEKEIKPVLTSADIGLAGEQEVEEILQERYRILNTAKSGKCGDFVITVNGVRILIEVKKYSKTVPSLEVDKFYRDIDSNASIGGAVLISLTSKIVGISRSIEHTHQYINGNKIPVMFLSLSDVDPSIAKTCVCSAVDILLAEVDSKNKYIDIGENIVHVVNDIDRNLDFLSQCRLMIHETQAMFNKQLGKLMQQVLSAEINIGNSVRLLKSKVDVVCLEDMCSTDAISDLKISLDTDKYNILSKLLDGRTVAVSKSANTIQTKDKMLSIKVTKSTIKVTIVMKLSKSIDIDGQWSYNGKALTVELTEKTLQTIMVLLKGVE